MVNWNEIYDEDYVKSFFQFLCHGSFFINNISLSISPFFHLVLRSSLLLHYLMVNGNDVIRVNERANVFAMEWRMSHLTNFFMTSFTTTKLFLLCLMKMSSLLCNLNMIMYSLCQEFTVPNKCCIVLWKKWN